MRFKGVMKSLELIMLNVGRRFQMLTDFITSFISSQGVLAYGIIFLLIFIETGLVVTPFLPGDSLLFISGALLNRTKLLPIEAIVLFAIAAIGGDLVNYSVGYRTGNRLLKIPVIRRFVKREDLIKTQRFF